MVKRTIKETVREYDTEGRLLRETVTETSEDDDTIYYPPYVPNFGPVVYDGVVNCGTQERRGYANAESR